MDMFPNESLLHELQMVHNIGQIPEHVIKEIQTIQNTNTIPEDIRESWLTTCLKMRDCLKGRDPGTQELSTSRNETPYEPLRAQASKNIQPGHNQGTFQWPNLVVGNSTPRIVTFTKAYLIPITEQHIINLKFKDPRNHGKKWVCNFINCGKIFTRLHGLRRHLDSHWGIKPFNCTHKGCNWKFARHTCLKRHLQRHKTNKPFLCNKCGHNFTEESRLKKHKRRCHFNF